MPRDLLSPNLRTAMQISRGKFDRLPHTPARSTVPPLDGYGLRGHTPARPGARPHIWFLFVRSWVCSALPSDPASRQRPCASLALHHHQVGQKTCTSKLSNLLGTRKYPPAKPGALEGEPLKAALGPLTRPQNFRGMFMHHHMKIEYPTPSHLTFAYTCFAHRIRSVASWYAHSRNEFFSGSIFYPAFASTIVGSRLLPLPRRLPEMSNFYCLPGRAGGPPLVG